MSFQNFIAHQLERAGDTAPIQLVAGERETELNGRQQELLRELKLTFVQKAGKSHGTFTGELDKAQLSQWLREVHEEKLSFTEFSRKAMAALKSELQNVELPLSGFFVFFSEMLANEDFFYLLLVEHNEGLFFTPNLALESSRFIDVKQLRWGVKVNVTEWLQDPNELGCVSQMRARGDKDLSDVLSHWIGFTNTVNTSEDTEEFLSIVEDFSRSLPEEDAKQYRQKVVEYCVEHDKRGEKVEYEALSQFVDDKEPSALVDYVMAKQPEPKATLIPDRSVLRQYVRFSGRNDQLSMSFSSDCLGESIMYDKATDSITITNVPPALRARLLKYLQEQNSGE
ncbi:nucleoid-associated protein [Marinibactrum halimedae]|uniref:Nucleoid-associated protein n=1 Tax=Marinibactrum halimedae TaxID=1444977 RepID=A0AA37WLW1_9GAMM|nr:nucleoid-associated protein [Marinibactrum halimedae]MCD9457471.1 nucleoid-associated protein [Marinibactrum halimedae]GLS25475.1 hypothetical protein GCM10007877_11890 [Marinibactrum halimedae]